MNEYYKNDGGQFKDSEERSSYGYENAGYADDQYSGNGGGFSGGPGFNSSNETGGGSGKMISIPRKTLVMLMIFFIVAAGGAGFGSSLLVNKYFPYGLESNGSSSSDSNSAKTRTAGYKLEDATGSKLTVKEIAGKVEDSIVEIYTESASTDSWMQQYIKEGAGSGVIVKSNGYIVTNNHVIEGANKITVTLSNNKRYEATLVGKDSQTDLAVLKIKARGLKAVTYGNSSQLSVGDMAVVIGNPLGSLGGTVTAGIISDTARKITIGGQNMSLIQTDASVNPGNSGGGLFNQYGQLAGVVVAKSSGSDVEGLGFAIPVNKVAPAVEEIIKNGKISGRAATGMAYSLSESRQDIYGGSSDGSEDNWEEQTGTVTIAKITGTQAKRAGFKIGDVVYAVDGQKITSISILKNVIQAHSAGDIVTYTVLRGGSKKDIDLELQEAST